MENVRKSSQWLDIGDDARRQYIDAQAVFSAWENARRNAAEVRGGMYWKRQGETEYLIRTSPRNSQKSLGPRSESTVLIYEKFSARKEEAEKRVADLTGELVRHQRMNRALFVGRAPQILVDILNRLYLSGIAEHFTVVGTHALYAYESAAGVRIGNVEALATRDVDLLWDTRKRLSFVTHMASLGMTLLGLIRKVDPTFELKPDQLYTAVNSKGFEVDIIRRETEEGDPHPLRVTDNEGELFAVQAMKAGVLLGSPRFSSMIVSSSGHMARMNTVSPGAFSEFKRWLAERPDREPMKQQRDILQAELVEELADQYLPHLSS